MEAIRINFSTRVWEKIDFLRVFTWRYYLILYLSLWFSYLEISRIMDAMDHTMEP